MLTRQTIMHLPPIVHLILYITEHNARISTIQLELHHSNSSEKYSPVNENPLYLILRWIFVWIAQDKGLKLLTLGCSRGI